MKNYCHICSNENIYALHAYPIYGTNLFASKPLIFEQEDIYCKKCFDYELMCGKNFDSSKTFIGIKAIKRYISTRILE